MRLASASSLFLLLLSACASMTVPMADAGSDADGKQFAPPPPGMAAIYLYSAKNAGVSPVLIDKRYIGELGPGTWLRLDVPAGPHEIACAFKDGDRGYVSSPAAAADPRAGWGPSSSRPVEAVAGSTSYFDIGFRVQWVGGILCTIAEVSEPTGRAGVAAGKRIQQQVR